MRQLQDDAISIESNRSREETTLKIKATFAELELLKQRNILLEETLRKAGIDPPLNNIPIECAEASAKTRIVEFKGWNDIKVNKGVSVGVDYKDNQ
jgi:hypothetical protein